MMSSGLDREETLGHLIGEGSGDLNAAPTGKNLESFLELPKQTRIAVTEGLGRVVLAERDFEIGDVILREEPVLVWKTTDWPDLFLKFHSLSDEQKEGVMDMVHPSLKSSLCRDLRLAASSLEAPFRQTELKVKLMAISNTNGHQYYGRPNLAYHESLTPMEIHGSGTSALFLYASKVAHSCEPNASYSSKTSDGKLEYRCIRPIQAGDMVTFSYLEKLFQTPAPLRRLQLKGSKDFICLCVRCQRPDDMRVMKCPTCSSFSATCSYDLDEVETWYCDSCGSLPDIFRTKVKQIETKWDGWGKHLHVQAMRDVTQLNVQEALQGTKEASKELSPTHHIVIGIMARLVTVAASQAMQLDSAADFLPRHIYLSMVSHIGRPRDLRLQAAEMGLAYVAKSECCAAQCFGRNCLSSSTVVLAQMPPHPAIFECTTEVFHVYRDLLEYDDKGHAWPPYCKAMLERYIQLMKVAYGEQDSDVAQLEKIMRANASGEQRSVATQARKTFDGVRGFSLEELASSGHLAHLNPTVAGSKKSNNNKKKGKQKKGGRRR